MSSRLVIFIALILLGHSVVTAQSSEAKRFFDSQIIIDGLCYPYYRPGTTLHRFPKQSDGRFDMADYRAGTGVDLAIWDIRRPEEMAKMIRAQEKGLFMNTAIIRSYAEIEPMFRENQHGWLFYTQHPWPLDGSIEPIEHWHTDGLRMLQIVYGSSIPVSEIDKLGTGSSNGDDETSGLTSLGKAVVAECNRLGILIDTSHCNRQTTLDIAALSTAPVTCSHAGCDAVTPAKRNKSDTEIQAIAETGGVFAITPIKFMLSDTENGATMDDFIRHLEHAIDLVGIEHVGIGSDLKRNGVSADETPVYTCPELNGETRWFELYDALRARGYEDANLAKIFGGNFLRVFREVLK